MESIFRIKKTCSGRGGIFFQNALNTACMVDIGMRNQSIADDTNTLCLAVRNQGVFSKLLIGGRTIIYCENEVSFLNEKAISLSDIKCRNFEFSGRCREKKRNR